MRASLYLDRGMLKQTLEDVCVCCLVISLLKSDLGLLQHLLTTRRTAGDDVESTLANASAAFSYYAEIVPRYPKGLSELDKPQAMVGAPYPIIIILAPTRMLANAYCTALVQLRDSQSRDLEVLLSGVNMLRLTYDY